jgi:hypothetical protein
MSDLPVRRTIEIATDAICDAFLGNRRIGYARERATRCCGRKRRIII